LEEVDFDLKRLLDGVVMLMSGMASAKGLAIQTDISNDVPTYIRGDSTRLRQILLNLISNAIKFTQEGRISVRVTLLPSSANHVVLGFKVVDTGIGIEPAHVDHLFDAFTQADSSITPRFGGTGLGLNICKRLVEGMQGAIGVESQPGKGSTFHFDASFKSAERPADAETTSQDAISPLRILVVDDDEVNLQVADGLLTQQGHQVVTATSGAKALVKLKGAKFDLVLMDMQMPEMDGPETTRRIRGSDNESSQVPILALTANSSPAHVAQCLEAGMNDHLSKPVRLDELRTKLNEWAGFDDKQPSHEISVERQTPSTLLDTQILQQLCSSIGEERLQELITIFNDSSIQALDDITNAWEKRNYHELAQKAHRLRGSSAALGLTRLAEFAGDTEMAANAQDEQRARHLLGQLATMTSRSVEALQESNCDRTLGSG
jgi:CheY-like chemotaxis protein